MDTTFDLCDMWLTDTAYQNLRILNSKNQHPWFFGPSFLYMKKSAETFSRFSLDMVVSKPGLESPTFLGTGMEKAMYDGFKKVFSKIEQFIMCETLIGC